MFKHILFLFIFSSLVSFHTFSNGTIMIRPNYQLALNNWKEWAGFDTNELEDFLIDPQGNISLIFKEGYLSFDSHFHFNDKTLLSLFNSTFGWGSKNITPRKFTWRSMPTYERILDIRKDGSLSLYDTLNGRWLQNIRALPVTEASSIYYDQFLTVGTKGILYPLLTNERPHILIPKVDSLPTATRLISKNSSVYYSLGKRTLVFNKLGEKVSNLSVLPRDYLNSNPKDFYIVNDDITLGLFEDNLIGFTHHGEVKFRIDFPSHNVIFVPYEQQWYIYLPIQNRLEFYQLNEQENQNILLPRDFIDLVGFSEIVGAQLEEKLLFDRAELFYKWIINKLDEILRKEKNDNLYNLRVKILNRLSWCQNLLNSADPHKIYFVLEQDGQGFKTIARALPKFQEDNYTVDVSLPWRDLLVRREHLSWEAFVEYPWEDLLKFSNFKALFPEEEFHILLSPEKRGKPFYFSFVFSKLSK